MLHRHFFFHLPDLIIKYDKYSVLIPSVSKYLKLDLLPDGKASILWMLGEFGEVLCDTSYPSVQNNYTRLHGHFQPKL